MTNFVLPIHPEDLQLPVQNRYNVQNLIRVDGLSEAAITKLLEDTSLRLRRQGARAIVEHENFDVLFSLLLRFEVLSTPLASRLFDTLVAGLGGIVKLTGDQLKAASVGSEELSAEQLDETKNALKMHMFLVHWFVIVTKPGSPAASSKAAPAAAAKGAKRGAAGSAAGSRKKARNDTNDDAAAAAEAATGRWESETAKEQLLSAMINLLELPELAASVWRAAQPDEDFVNLFSKVLVTMLASASNTRAKPVRRCLLLLCAQLIKRYAHSAAISSALVHLLHHGDHLPQPLGELYALLDTPAYKCAPAATGDLLREIGRMSSAQLTPLAKNVAELLRELADKLPNVVLPHIAVLLPHLDGENHWMRIGIVQMLGQLLCHLSAPELAPAAQRDDDGADECGLPRDAASDGAQRTGAAPLDETRRSMQTVLQQRVFDVSPWVRSQALQTWAMLASKRAIAMDQLERVARLAVSRLSDKNFAVRRSAVNLVTTLMEYNPFGPQLCLSKFAAELDNMRRLRQEMRVRDAARAQAFLDKQQQQQREQADDQAAAAAEDADRPDGDKPRKAGRHPTEPAEDDIDASDDDHDEDDDDDEDDEDTDGTMANKRHKSASKKSNKLRNKRQPLPTSAAAAADDDDDEDDAEADGGQAALMIDEAEAALRAEQRRLHRRCQQAVGFIERLHEALAFLSQLLGSKLLSDVLDTMHCFVTARLFGVEPASEGLKKMLPLVWSSEAKVRDKLIESYKQLYVVPDTDTTTDPNLRTANNLIGLTVNATLAELTSLEQLLSAMYARHQLPPGLVHTLWGIFGARHKRLSQLIKAERRGSLVILSMLANAQPDIVKDKLNVLVNIGLGARWKDDVFLARYTCIALQKLARRQLPLAAASDGSAKHKQQQHEQGKENQVQPQQQPDDDKQTKSSAAAPAAAAASEAAPTFQRLAPSHVIFKRLAEIMVERDLPHSSWYALAEQAINTIYALSEQPDKLCATVIKTYAGRVFAGLRGTAAPQVAEANAVDEQQQQQHAAADDDDDVAAAADDDDQQQQQQHAAAAVKREGGGSNKSTTTQVPVGELSKLLFALGHVALKQIVHVDEIQAELRRRRADADRSKLDAADGTKKRRAGKGGKGGKEAAGASTIEQELGVAQAAEEHEAERLQEMAEREIVSGRNLVGAFGPLVALVCANAGNRYNDESLRAPAVLCLCKFMCVSPDFCERHLQLLFTLFKRSPEPAIRSNIVIVIGDLAVRFPTLIEPWTNEMYACLHDSHPRVRKSAFMVLAHLVLNDQIRVRGQISEMAACLADTDRRLIDLSRLFFTELSRKGNAIYNLLPDVISALSSRDSPVGAEAHSAVGPTAKFKEIMKFLFDFIDKEKQSESLVDKLCHRFEQTAELAQWRNIAYCLSLLSYSDKVLRRLNEHAKLWSDKLSDAAVKAAFDAIASKARKFAKPEMKEPLAEFDAKLAAPGTDPDADPAHDPAADPTSAVISPSKTAAAASKPPAAAHKSATTTSKGRGRGGRGGKTPAAARKRAAAKTRRYDSSASEDDGSDDAVDVSDDAESAASEPDEPARHQQQRQPKSKAKQATAGRGRRQQQQQQQTTTGNGLSGSDEDDTDQVSRSKPKPSASKKRPVRQSSRANRQPAAVSDEDETD
eukprot:TRINITY_DN985_c0_g1_i5.p1 TRINITY_DN985_c0_g1~~TRINITY_DN985_c0_g1_i5.p1  ORF type:complete len:1640 (+),score=672.83 TRINITY_DN985_c0_g1_i5:197-5116(+)